MNLCGHVSSINQQERVRTNEREHVPRKVTDTIDVRRHKGHDLCLARKVILIVLTVTAFITIVVL